MAWPPFIPPDRALSPNVARARAEFAQTNERNREILEPLVSAHLTGYDAARTELVDAHRYVTDQTDLDLQGKSREAGQWLIAGRCLGLAHAAHIAVAAWLIVEVMPVLRSLHEAMRLLSVFRLPGEEALVDRWLKGRNVSRRDVMAASQRQEAKIREEMLRHGFPPASETSDHF